MSDGGGKDVPPGIKPRDGRIAPAPEVRRNEVMAATVKFGKYFVARYPQVDLGQPLRYPEPRLNYAFAGSLAIPLFSQAEGFTHIKLNHASGISEEQAVKIPQETRQLLGELTRPIADVDVFETDFYRSKKKDIYPLHGEELRRARAGVIMPGNDLLYAAVPPDAQPALDIKNKEKPILIDPAYSPGEQGFSKIIVEGTEFFMVSPQSFVPNKVLNMLEKRLFVPLFPEKFGSEFVLLHNAMRGLYSEESLVADTANLIRRYDAHNEVVMEATGRKTIEALTGPRMIEGLLTIPSLPQETRTFIEKVQAVPVPSQAS